VLYAGLATLFTPYIELVKFIAFFFSLLYGCLRQAAVSLQQRNLLPDSVTVGVVLHTTFRFGKVAKER